MLSTASKFIVYEIEEAHSVCQCKTEKFTQEKLGNPPSGDGS